MSDKTTDGEVEAKHIDLLSEELPNGDRHGFQTRIYVTDSCDTFDLALDILGVCNADPTGPPAYMASEIIMKKHKRGELRARPMRLRREMAQDLMDQLLAAGIRPTGKPDLQDGEREALQKQVEILTAEIESLVVLAADAVKAGDQHRDDLRSERDFLRNAVEVTTLKVSPGESVTISKKSPMERMADDES